MLEITVFKKPAGNDAITKEKWFRLEPEVEKLLIKSQTRILFHIFSDGNRFHVSGGPWYSTADRNKGICKVRVSERFRELLQHCNIKCFHREILWATPYVPKVSRLPYCRMVLIPSVRSLIFSPPRRFSVDPLPVSRIALIYECPS